jgi:hypothetical protein
MTNLAPVEFPALSLTRKTYVHSADIVVPLVYAAPFNVAHERLVSSKLIAISVL